MTISASRLESALVRTAGEGVKGLLESLHHFYRMPCCSATCEAALVPSPIVIAMGAVVRLRPEHANHVWSYDLVSAKTHDGRTVRILNLIDEHSRKCLMIRPEHSFTASGGLKVPQRQKPRGRLWFNDGS